MISLPQVKEEHWTLALQFYLDQYGLPHVDKASINEVYYEEVPVKNTKKPEEKKTEKTDKPADKPGDKTEEAKPEGETKPTEPVPEEKKTEKVKKERSTVCIIKLVDCVFGLTQSLLDEITQKEANLENDDKLLRVIKNRRNEIENYIYSTRPKLDNEIAPYITSEEKELLQKYMNEVEDWFYSGDESVYNKQILDEKSKNLNDLGGKIGQRHMSWEKLEEAFNKLEKCINLNIKNLSENDAILLQNEKDEIAKHIQTFNNNLNEGRVMFGKSPKFMDTPMKFEDVNKASEELVKV